MRIRETAVPLGGQAPEAFRATNFTRLVVKGDETFRMQLGKVLTDAHHGDAKGARQRARSRRGEAGFLCLCLKSDSRWNFASYVCFGPRPKSRTRNWRSRASQAPQQPEAAWTRSNRFSPRPQHPWAGATGIPRAATTS